MHRSFWALAALLLAATAWPQNNCPLVNNLSWSPTEIVGDGTHTATATITWTMNGFQGKYWALDIGNFPPSYYCDSPGYSGGIANVCYINNGPTSTTVTALFGVFSQTQQVNLQTAAIADSCGGGAFGYILVDPPGTTTTAPSTTDPNPSPGDPSQPTCSDCSSDPQAGGPINLANGNTWIKQSDYSIPGARGGLELTRTWNSGWQGSGGFTFGPPSPIGMFGAGWTSTYEQRLQSFQVNGIQNGYKTYDGYGNSNFFQYNSGTNSYSIYAPFSANATLTFSSSTQQFTYTISDGTQYIFSQPGYLVAIKDRNGNTTSVTLDGQNRITQVTDAVGRSITFAYTDSHNPNQATSISDGCTSCTGGATIANYYYYQDGTNRLQKITYSDGTILQFQYNDPNSTTLISEVDDGAGKVIEKHSYDSSRRGLTSSKAVVPGSSTPVDYVSINWPAAGQTPGVAVTNSLGSATGYYFTTVGQRNVLWKASGPGCSTCFSHSNVNQAFSKYGELTWEQDANGNTSVLTYDANHNLANRTTNIYDYLGNYVAGQTWTYTYNSFAEVLTATDPLHTGSSNSYDMTVNAYDTHGNLQSTTTPSPDGGTTQGSKTQFGHDSNGFGEVISVTDPLNNVTNISYTPATSCTNQNVVGLVATITDAQDNTTKFCYDPRGNRTDIYDPLSNHTSFNYDGRSRLTKITYPDSSTTLYGYDSTRGRLHTVTDQNGKVTTYDYDDADRLIKVTDAQSSAGITQYNYDTEDNLTSLTDALNRVTSFQYKDANGNPQPWLSETDFPLPCPNNPCKETYGYDSVGNLTKKIDRKGQEIDYKYDTVNRLNYKTWVAASPAYAVVYAYDVANRLTTAVDCSGTNCTPASGTYSFTYDNMDRLTEADSKYSFITGTPTYAVKYTYDAASNRKTMTDPQSIGTTYNYDTLNRLYQLLSPQGTFGFGYDNDSRRTSLTRPNSVNTTYSYDVGAPGTTCFPLKLCQILHQNGSTTLDGATYSFAYSGVTDNINWKQKKDDRTNDTYGFVYDNIYQLTQVYKNSTLQNTNTYDAVGNYNVSGWNHNNANQLTSRPSVTYSYDNNGSQLTQVNANGPDPGTENFTWDYENRLVNFAPPTGDTNLYKKAYTYDPFGRLVRELATNNTTGVTVSDATYIWDGANDFEQLNTANSNVVEKYVYGLGVDEPLALVSGSASVFVEQDALGSITTLTNSSGAISDTFVYGTNGWGEPSHTSGTTSLFLRFTGRDYDGSSNLYYLRARWYDPATGRFISEDPVRFRGGADFYSYVTDNPINHTDPFGLLAELYCEPVGTSGHGFLHGAAILASGAQHCFIRVKCSGIDKTYELEGPQPGQTTGHPAVHDFDPLARPQEGWPIPIANPVVEQCPCGFEDRLIRAFQEETQHLPAYNGYPGPNSNTFAHQLIIDAGGTASFPFDAYGWDWIPGASH